MESSNSNMAINDGNEKEVDFSLLPEAEYEIIKGQIEGNESFMENVYEAYLTQHPGATPMVALEAYENGWRAPVHMVTKEEFVRISRLVHGVEYGFSRAGDGPFDIGTPFEGLEDPCNLDTATLLLKDHCKNHGSVFRQPSSDTSELDGDVWVLRAGPAAELLAEVHAKTGIVEA